MKECILALREVEQGRTRNWRDEREDEARFSPGGRPGLDCRAGPLRGRTALHPAGGRGVLRGPGPVSEKRTGESSGGRGRVLSTSTARLIISISLSSVSRSRVDYENYLWAVQLPQVRVCARGRVGVTACALPLSLSSHPSIHPSILLTVRPRRRLGPACFRRRNRHHPGHRQGACFSGRPVCVVAGGGRGRGVWQAASAPGAASAGGRAVRCGGRWQAAPVSSRLTLPPGPPGRRPGRAGVGDWAT